MANGRFTPPQIDFGSFNPLQSYATGLAWRKKQDTDAARKDALSGLLSGQDPRDAIQKLLGVGAVKDAQGVATIWKTLNPQAKPKFGPIGSGQYGWTSSNDQSVTPYTPPGGVPEKPTVGDIALDRKYAPDLLQWKSGGRAEADLGIAALDEAINNLEHKNNISGPLVGYAVKNPGGIAGGIGYAVDPAAFQTAQLHKRAVVASLRPILGSRPAQQIIQQIIEATYDPSLKQPYNAQRLKLLRKSLIEARDAKDEMANYYTTNKGTLKGYEGKNPDDIIGSLSGGIPDESVGGDAGLDASAVLRGIANPSSLVGVGADLTGGPGTPIPMPQAASPPPPMAQPMADTGPPLDVPPVPGSQSYTSVPANTPPTTDPRGSYVNKERERAIASIMAQARTMLKPDQSNKKEVIQWLKTQGIDVNADN